MRNRPTPWFLAYVLLLTSCDKIYFARLDVGPPSSTQVAVAPLSQSERERAIAAFRTTANELGLSCAPAKYPIITGSYDTTQYALSSCRVEGTFTQVQLADSASHVTVEVHQIGGMSEPGMFRRCRRRFTEALQAAFPGGRVRVRYPYHWGRDE